MNNEELQNSGSETQAPTSIQPVINSHLEAEVEIEGRNESDEGTVSLTGNTELEAAKPVPSEETDDEDDQDDEDDEDDENFDPASYVEPSLEDNVVESAFVARSNGYKKGTIEWIREEHAIVTEHLSHAKEDYLKFSRILKLDHALVHSSKLMLKEASEDLEELTKAQESLNSWIHERQSTYAWQLLEALTSQRSRIDEFESEVKAWCEKPTEELYESSFKHKKKFKRKLKWGLGGIIAAFSIGTIVNLILSALGIHWFVSILALIAAIVGIGNPFASIPAIIGGLSIFTWIAALVTYFREYLKFRKQLEAQVLEARFYLRAAKELGLQKSKIAFLHSQVQDYLVFLAEVLHKPWKIQEKWLNYETSSVDSTKLPTSLQVATPIESNVYQEVIKKSIEDFASTNWRTRQFESLVKNYEKIYAMPDNSLSSRIYTDKNLRTKIQVDIGESEVLKSVGDDFVLELAKHLQQNTLPTELGFHVESIKKDSLGNLDLSSSILSDSEEKINWHDFVTAILGQACGWSNLAYSIRGLEDKLVGSNSVSSFALIPERLRADVSSPVEAVPVKKDDNAGIEVIVRVDVSGWIDPEKVKVLTPDDTYSAPAQNSVPFEPVQSDVEIRG